ncbi:MAG: hypothetical protein O2843_09695, partial [Chloroflexi bacterium]|nr:hypothetical protein [Chloroflexota bacterium]
MPDEPRTIAASAAEARAALDASIALTARLGREFGYRMGYRVIHLVRNDVHVENLLGAKALALDEAIALARFVGGDGTAWRDAALGAWDPVTELDGLERQLACDDALGELALAAAWQPDRLDRA